jgi:hypothetical protein
MVSKINVPENTIIVGEITQRLIDDGITPTADKINELAAEQYAIQGAIVGEQQPPPPPVLQKQESVRTQIQTARHQVMTENILPVQQSISVSPPSSINTVVPPVALHQPYLNSVTHNNIAVVAGQMVQADAAGYSTALYGELVQQWMVYYSMNPQQALLDFQSNELEQCQVMHVKALQAQQNF